MIQVALLLAGMILLSAVSAPWAATVGIICLVVFAVITILQIIALATVRKAQKSLLRDFDRRF